MRCVLISVYLHVLTSACTCGQVNASATFFVLQGGHAHIPYRNAKLTRLLKDCLGGTSVTAIICTIGPCDKYNQETAGVCTVERRFGSGE